MTATPGLFSQYQQALQLSQLMLGLARRAEWNNLVEREVDYLNAIEALSQQQQVDTLPLTLQDTLRPILRELIDNEAEIRELLQQRLGELRSLVGQNNLQQSVNHAYGNLAGSVLIPGQPS